jgi:hypothetical protein
MHFTNTIMSLLPEQRENVLKRSCPRSFIIATGMILALSCTFSLPAAAEPPADASDITLDGIPSIFSATTATGSEKEQTQVPFKQEDMVPLGPVRPTFLDSIQSDISENILQSAMWLDSFFYDSRYTAEENETRAIVRYESFLEDHAGLTFKTKLKLVLNLPQLKNKANLVIGDPNDENRSQPGQGLLTSTAPLENTNRHTSAALSYQIKSSERLTISARIGFRYRNGRIVSFLRPYYRRLYRLVGWDLRITQELPYWTDTKWSSSTTIDLERPLGNAFFFRTSLNGTWYEHVAGYYYGLLFSLSQPLSSVSALNYELGASFQTGPHDLLEAVVVDTRYRRRFWRDWMYFDIAPQVRFPRDRQFKAVPGILFGLEMQFGQGWARTNGMLSNGGTPR